MRMCGNLKICGLLMRIRVWLGKDRYAKAEPIGQTKKTTSEMNGAGEKVERGKRGSRGMGGTHHGLSNSQTEEPCESRRHSWVISGSMAAFESLRDEGGECLATEGAEAPATWSRNPAPGSRGVGGWRGEKNLGRKIPATWFPHKAGVCQGENNRISWRNRRRGGRGWHTPSANRRVGRGPGVRRVRGDDGVEGGYCQAARSNWPGPAWPGRPVWSVGHPVVGRVSPLKY